MQTLTIQVIISNFVKTTIRAVQLFLLLTKIPQLCQKDFVYIHVPPTSKTFTFLRSSSTIAEQPHPPTQSLCFALSIDHPATHTKHTKPSHHVTKKPFRNQEITNEDQHVISKRGGDSKIERKEEKKKKTLSKMIYMKTYSIRSPQDPRANARHSGWSSRRVAVRWLSCMPRVRQPRCRSSWRRTGRAAPSSRRRLARRRGTRVDLVAEDGEHLEGVHGGGSRW